MGTFQYFGETLRQAEEYPYFLEAQFHEARTREELNLADAMGYALRLAQACVHPDDRLKFMKISQAHNAKFEDWVKLSRDFMAVEAERPTGQPTDSSSGPENSPDSSASPPVASVTSLPAVPAAKAKRPPRGDLGLTVARSAGLV